MGESLLIREDIVAAKEVFIIRKSRAGATTSTSTVKMPSGVRVRTLDRGVFERAVKAAENFVERRNRDVSTEEAESPVKHERAAG
jgi:hypothetical protein